MKIDYVTFTGIDNNTDKSMLNNIAIKHPIIEWGVLFSYNKMGTQRYPNLEWIKYWETVVEDYNLKTSLHMCGRACINLIQGDYSLINKTIFQRIQLNLNYSKSHIVIDNIINLCKAFPNKRFIIQYNKSNYPLILELPKTLTNIDLLVDASGGRGVQNANWPAPLKGFNFSYAGGLNPDNIKENLEAISAVVPQDYVIGIDMESGIRTNNEFDFEKCEQILEEVYNFNK